MALKKVGRWLGRRLREKSTYIGLTTVAVAIGAPASVISGIGQVGQIAAVIFGSGLMAASTAVHTE
jgi:hypothetical protein